MFKTIDIGIVGAYLVGVTALGALTGRGAKTTQEYFLAGRKAPWWLATLSIVATETSTLTFVAVPGIGFSGNLTFLQVAAGFVIGRILVALFFVPLYFKGEIQTSYEILQKKFGPRVRKAVSGVFCVTRLLGDGVRLFSACVVLKEVLAVFLGSWEGNELAAVFIIGILTVFYTFMGGLKGVLWTDMVQLLLYISGGAFALIFALHCIPLGLGEIISNAYAAGKLRFLDVSLGHVFFNGYSLAGGVIGGAMLSMATHGTDQLIVQRLISCGRVKEAGKAVIFSGIIVFLQMAFFLCLGIVLWQLYKYNVNIEFKRPDDVFPHFLVRRIPSGVSGLIVAAAFAAAMSTLSSSLNSLSSVTVNEFHKSFSRSWDEKSLLSAGKSYTVLWGILLILFAIPARDVKGLLDAGLAIAGLTSGGVLGVFLANRFLPGARHPALGMFFAILTVFALWILPKVSGPSIPRLHWTWFTPLGVMVVFLFSLFSEKA